MHICIYVYVQIFSYNCPTIRISNGDISPIPLELED